MLRLASITVLLLSAMPSAAVIRSSAELQAGMEVAMQGQSAGQIMMAAQVRIDAKQAAAAVKQRYGGKILSVQLIESKGPPVYRVKTITPDGVVKVVFVDGESGEVFE